jgi:hypothetical protein
MGMILGFFLVAYIAIAVGIYLFIKHYVGMKWVNRITLAILILIPTYDIIITNVLAGYYCFTTPSTYINKKVEYPESIYWNNSVASGLDQNGRKMMIRRYLDGVHLKKMALNGKDGKIYVYEIDSSAVWQPLKALKYDSGKEYFDMVNKIAENIMQTSQKIYIKETMPKMKYTVTFDEVKLNSFSRKFLYAEEIKVIDNKTNEVIAYNRRYMHFFYNISMGLGGNSYDLEPICGKRERIEYKIFNAYNWTGIHF